mgnify:CR=1 FL=1
MQSVKSTEQGQKKGEMRMYENRTVEEVCREFSVDLRTGLSAAEVEVRQRHYGENELREAPPRSLIVRIGAQLCDSLIFVLFAAAGISLLLGEYGDAGVILAVVVLNATVGVIQEGKAEKALESLKRMTQLEAVVIREGKEREIAARELVPGDLVVLDAGRQVPADLRLTETAEMRAEESALTGESRAVEKNSHFLAAGALPVAERKNETFMTSYVTAGRGKGIVIATGMNTEVGRIASLIREAPEEETPLQKRLSDLGKLLSILTIGLCVLLFALAVWQKRDVMEMLLTAISLAVAAVPEGLPTTVTIVLALGVTKMARAGTIVRRLPSVETLGAVSVVCSDKTGTLTKNERYLLSFAAEAFGGNIAQYKQRIYMIAGVGGCKVQPVWNGPSTVKVVVISSEFGACSEYLVSQIQKEACPVPRMGYGFAPIDHDTTIESVEAVMEGIRSENRRLRRKISFSVQIFHGRDRG